MRPFDLDRAATLEAATQLGETAAGGAVAAPVQFLAGGTTVLDLMKLDVLRPERLVDLNPLRKTHAEIEVSEAGLTLGAFASMAAAAQHDGVRREYPAIAQSLALAASQQLRNMATLGGNVLQRTRCSYFRDPSFEACNKRRPGSGCAALKGVNRHHAVLGASEDCISQYPGDFAAALVALDAEVELTGPTHTRRIAFETLHRGSERPDVETDLRPGEVITRFFAPASPRSRRSLYVKVRDRQSYAFAIASAAVALELDQGQVLSARIALGAMAYRPWRARDAEAALVGRALTEASAEAAGALALSGAVGRGHNDYKIALGARTVARALLEAAKLEMDHG